MKIEHKFISRDLQFRLTLYLTSTYSTETYLSSSYTKLYIPFMIESLNNEKLYRLGNFAIKYHEREFIVEWQYKKLNGLAFPDEIVREFFESVTSNLLVYLYQIKDFYENNGGSHVDNTKRYTTLEWFKVISDE